jgi:hypothetical protein
MPGLPSHIFVAYETMESLTQCSAVIGYIGQIAAVLLIERDENVLTSITNALPEVIKAVTPRALRTFRQHGPVQIADFAWLPYDQHDLVWLSCYECRIITEGQYADPAIMRIDIQAETWVPIEAPIAEGLEPFLRAFRAATIKAEQKP